jgi:peptidoglycan/LPS O-acetylase OafA/YrhL
MPATAPASRANNFDALRLIAALSVVFSHSFLIAEGSEAHEPFIWLTGNQCVVGLTGVFVFFAISGYLVTESYCRRPSPPQFALRRVARIWPGLLVNGLVCALVLGPIVTVLPVSEYLSSAGLPRFLLQILSLYPGPLELPGVLFADTAVGRLINGSVWTLRYEVMMYAMVLLLAALRLLRLGSAIALVIVGIIGVYLEDWLTPLGDFGEWAWFVGFFASGMAVYFLRDRLDFGWRYALLAIATLAAFTWMGRLIMLFPLTGAYLAISFARRYDPTLDYARYTGDLSYGLYIYGWPCEQFVMYLSGGRASWYQVFFGSLAIALPLAWLSWHLVEKRALHWAQRGVGAAKRLQAAGTSAPSA